MNNQQYTWAVSIEGDEADLEAASGYFSDLSAGRIVNLNMHGDSSRWVLVSSRFENLTDEGDVQAEAQSILNVMSGLLFADDWTSEPVRLSGKVHRRAQNGNWGVTVFIPAATVRMVRRTGVSKQQTVFLGRMLDGHDQLRRAIGYLSNQPGWFDIYTAIECLSAHYGGEHQLLRQPWADTLQIKALKSCANYHRHANARKPRIEFTLAQARRLISQIVQKALLEESWT